MTGTPVTFTNAVAIMFEPSILDAVMVAEPDAIAVTSPLETVAAAELLDDHTID